MHVYRVCERIHAGCDGGGVPGSTRCHTTQGNPCGRTPWVEFRWDTRSPSRSCESLSCALLGHQGLCGAPSCAVFPRGREGNLGSRQSCSAAMRLRVAEPHLEPRICYLSGGRMIAPFPGPGVSDMTQASSARRGARGASPAASG